MDFLPVSFGALKTYKQFILYVLNPSNTRPGKTDKFPVDYRTGQIANAHDQAIWLDAHTAIDEAKIRGAGYGVGFVLTEQDPFFFLDIDDCLESPGTSWSQVALNLLAAFNGAAVEISASGRGLHILGCGSVPVHACRNADYKVELYTSNRFVALTGTSAMGDISIDCTLVLEWLVTNYFTNQATGVRSEWTNTPVDAWNGSLDDDELIQRMLRSTSARGAFGSKVTAQFRDLWDGNTAVLREAYPDPHRAIGYDQSSADAALAQHLAFWTGSNCERMLKLMWMSKLVREKWQREDYLPRTILGACGRQKEWLYDKPPEKSNITEPAQEDVLRPVLVEGTTFLTVAQQCDLFTGCVYVMDEHKALIPGGYLLSHDRFRVMFGGYSMALDARNEKTTRNAWESFTESQAFRVHKADSSTFLPNSKPGTIITRNGQTFVNVYWPTTVARALGDVTPFLNHMKLLFPNETDRMIILCYMAAIVQHKGIKFQWCPVIQGVQGNGKTLLTRCVAYAIGERYTHYPKASEIASKFNDWMFGKIFIGVEDIYVPDARLEVMEALKPMITAERQEIEPKGGVKMTKDICANFLINTNHRDGLRKTADDRRFAPFYTPQQMVEDLVRDKMTGEYFPRLYTWLNNGGYAVVSEYLHTFEIPDDHNPAVLAKRAPYTTSTQTAIEQGLGRIEQRVLELIEQDQVGFRYGWVSSMSLDRALKEMGLDNRVPMNKRREMMKTLGYDWHPALDNGRCNRIVMPDNGKPRLYIHESSKHLHITTPSGVVRAYEEDQQRIVDNLL